LFICHRFAYEALSAAAMLGLLWALMLSATLRCAATWLFRIKLTLRQEIAFWIVVPTGILLVFVASIVQSAILTRHLIAIELLVEDLRLEQRPRHLTERQIASLEKQLAPAAGHNITVWSYMGDAEAWSYAEDLLQAFRDARWQTEPLPVPSTLRMQGVSMLVDDQTHLSQPAALVQSAFRKSKVPIDIIQFKTNLQNTVILFVGRKKTD
jgi:hypothetical protein